ncbi:MAG: TetR/AcrR family transcriptional regulator C-terminal ligand-binding domain-containing protein [Microthrixaceae bacterium]
MNRELFRSARGPCRGPTVIALRAMARGEIDPNTDVDMAMHMIQGPLISMRIVDDSEVGDRALDTMLDMTVRALGAPL